MAVEAPNGAPMGSLEFCFATAEVTPSGGAVATGTASFRLEGGTIAATFQLLEIPIANGEVVQVDTGVVTGGTGAFCGRVRRVAGGRTNQVRL